MWYEEKIRIFHHKIRYVECRQIFALISLAGNLKNFGKKILWCLSVIFLSLNYYHNSARSLAMGFTIGASDIGLLIGQLVRTLAAYSNCLSREWLISHVFNTKSSTHYVPRRSSVEPGICLLNSYLSAVTWDRRLIQSFSSKKAFLIGVLLSPLANLLSLDFRIKRSVSVRWAHLAHSEFIPRPVPRRIIFTQKSMRKAWAGVFLVCKYYLSIWIFRFSSHLERSKSRAFF